MTARFFADADPARRAKTFALMRRRPVISTQVVNEFLNVLIGKQRVPRDVANRYARILLRAAKWSP